MPGSGLPNIDEATILAALAKVNDPEIRRPITEINMVESVAIEGFDITVRLLLTVSGCPMKDRLTTDITAAVKGVAPEANVRVDLGVMSDEQRKSLQELLRGGTPTRDIPFARPDNLTRIYAITSGKGGVGKSSVTVNLAAAMANQGLKVGVLDADVYGHSIPDMLGVGDQRPTQVEEMILPVPVQVEGKGTLACISIGQLKPQRDQVVAWRGPMLDRALVQMLSDVYWGDLDALFLDLPPGTGDMAISLGQHLPNAEVIVVTTPQTAAAHVAERAGTMASMLHQKVIGVIENMSYLQTDTGRIEVFGSGGGQKVADALSERLGYEISLLGQIPLDPQMRESGDTGNPVVGTETEAGEVLRTIAANLTSRSRGLAGMQLGLSPNRK